MTPCFCLQIPASHQRASPPSASNGMLPPAARPAKGKCTTAVTLLDLIKDVEISISCRKGRTGTAAGDVAFPKGKENLASVLKRYKRRLSNKPGGMSQDGPGSRKSLNAAASAYGPMGWRRTIWNSWWSKRRREEAEESKPLLRYCVLRKKMDFCCFRIFLSC